LLPSLVKSLGIETNEISTEQEQNFDNATKVLSSSLANLSDEEFNNLSIVQEYSKDEFIKDTLSIVKDIPQEERQKVYDYFGFELHHNRKAPTGFSIAQCSISVFVNSRKNSIASCFIFRLPRWCGCSLLCSMGRSASSG
jgi:hypothetical protein